MTAAQDAFAEECKRFQAENPDIATIEALLPDINGVARGKWLPGAELESIARQGIRLPAATFGETIRLAGGLRDTPGIEPGDPDGICLPVPGSLCRIPWLARPAAQLQLAMFEKDGTTPYMLDPRQLLGRVLQRFRAHDWEPVVAFEYEFFLFPAAADGAPAWPPAISNDVRLYELDALQAAAPVLDDIRHAAAQQNVPVTACVAEFAPGQFELNLAHVADAARAADWAVRFKRLVKRVAASHGLRATFMAVPVANVAGNGCHIHVSVNAPGGNLFNEPGAGPEAAGPRLRAAVAGAMRAVEEAQLVFTPHQNSFRRIEGAQAPGRVRWGYDHRDAAVRVGTSHGPSARLEHRVAGADTHPCLILAAVLAGMLDGLENSLDAGPPLATASTATEGAALIGDWKQATERFAGSDWVADWFGRGFQELYADVKRREMVEMRRRVTELEYETYFDRV